MSLEKKKLYVGCGLTQAPDEFIEQVEALKSELRRDWQVMEFLGLTAGTAADVYRQDILTNVATCDAFLGICDEPSIGLGWELGTAVHLQKPTLAVAHTSSRITRLIIGAPEYNPNFSFERYQDMTQDVPPLASQHLC